MSPHANGLKDLVYNKHYEEICFLEILHSQISLNLVFLVFNWYIDLIFNLFSLL